MAVVLAGVAFVRRADGGAPLQLEQGAPVPDEASEEHVEALTARGVLGDKPTPAEPDPDEVTVAIKVGEDELTNVVVDGIRPTDPRPRPGGRGAGKP